MTFSASESSLFVINIKLPVFVVKLQLPSQTERQVYIFYEQEQEFLAMPGSL